MAMSNKVRLGSIVVGCLLLVFTLISVVFGSVVISKMPNSAAIRSLGLWGLYFAVPGVISIRAGIKKDSNLLSVSLVTHILGTCLSIGGVVTGAIFWERLNDCDTRFRSNSISCYYYDIEGSDLETVRCLTGVLALIFLFLAGVTLIGLHYGCTGIFWASKEPAVMVRSVQPGTVVMTTQSYPAYNQQLPSYGQGEVIADINGQY